MQNACMGLIIIHKQHFAMAERSSLPLRVLLLHPNSPVHVHVWCVILHNKRVKLKVMHQRFARAPKIMIATAATMPGMCLHMLHADRLTRIEWTGWVQDVDEGEDEQKCSELVKDEGANEVAKASVETEAKCNQLKWSEVRRRHEYVCQPAT